MAVSVEVVRFQKDSTGTTNATQDVTFSFTPKAIMVFSDGSTSDNSAVAHYQWIQGFSDGTNHACICAVSDDADAAADSCKSHRNDSVFIRLLEDFTTITVQSRATCAFATNKVTFTWVVNDTAATYITVVALAGSDITNVKVATVDTTKSGTGTQDYTGLGFNPSSTDSILFTLAAGATSTGETDIAKASFGAAVSSTQRWCMNAMSENTSDPTDTWRSHRFDKCLYYWDDAGALDGYADFSAWITDGFRLDWIDATSVTTFDFSYMVIKGGTWDVGSFVTPASAQSANHSVSVSSRTLRGLITTGIAAGDTAGSIATVNTIHIGATDGTTESLIATIDEDGQNSADSYRVNSANGTICRTLNANAANISVGAFTSFGTNQFTVNWTTASAAQYFGYVVVADGAATLYERALTESSISVSETLARTYIQPRTLSESSISVSESVPRILYANRSLSESSISVSETLARVLTAMRVLEESGISVSETISTLFTQVRSIDESVSVSETVDRILTAFRTITESTIDVSETVSGNLFFLRDISEAAISVSETLARTLYANRAIDENVAVSETIDRILTAFRTIGEAGISVSETLDALFIQVRSIDESVSVSDSLERMATFFRTISESAISVSEQLDRILTANRIITESSIAVSETVDRQLLAFRTLAESSIAVSETLDRVLTAFRTISEPSTSVSESLDRILTAMRTLSESSISVSDLLERTFYANRESIETVNVSEQLERILSAYRTIDESSISVSETVTYFVPIVRTITEPSISVSDSIARLLSAFRVVSESVSVSDHLAIVGPDYEIAVYITDKGYTNSLRARIRFVDRHDESHVLYEYDSFNPDQRPFNILGASIRLAQGEIGGFTINIEDSAKTVIKDNIGFGTKVQIDVKKEYGIPWMRVMTGFIRRVGKIRSATNTLQWQIAGVGTQVVFNERVTNYKRAAKRSSVDSIDPLPTDSRMFASNLFKDLISATDILPLRRPSLMETGGFTLDEISPDVTDFIAQVSPGLTDAASVANAFSELTGAIWGCNSEGNPFFRYPTQKHSGIIIKDDPQDTDSALITSTNLDAFDYQDSIDLSEGFANRLYVLNAVDTKSTASSSGASGSTTLTFRGIAQQFTATDNNINSAAFILSKVGNPTNKDNCVFGYLRGDSNGYPTGPTLASFQITFDQIDTAKSTIFVNDIKPKEGTIIPGNKYWWFLFSALTSESNTIRWHHDNDQLTINRFSAILPFIDQDPTKAGNQLFWTRSDKGPVYAFSTFSSIRHILEHSDPESIKEYGLVEGIVDLPAFEDDNTFQKALLQILKTSSKPKRIYNYARVTIPTQTLFFPGELVTIIDSKADLTSEKNVIAEIAQVQYTFDTSRNAMGCKTVDIMLMGFVDKVIDDYLDNNQC